MMLWMLGFGFGCQPPPLDPFVTGTELAPPVDPDPVSCGPCNTGTQASGSACVGALDNEVQGLVQTAGTLEASTVYEDEVEMFGPEFARDDDPQTSWFSAGPDDGPSVLTWTSPRADCITAVRLRNNDLHATPTFQVGFGFGEAELALYDGGVMPVWQTVVDLSATPDPNVDVDVAPESEGVFADRLVITFTGHEDPTCGGVSEVGVTAVFD